MTIIGNPRSFHKRFKFVVEIDDVGHAGFQKCSEFSVEVANVQYSEGGSLIPKKSPGRLTFSDVDLQAEPGHRPQQALDGLPSKVIAAEYRTVLPTEPVLVAEIEKTMHALETCRVARPRTPTPRKKR